MNVLLIQDSISLVLVTEGRRGRGVDYHECTWHMKWWQIIPNSLGGNGDALWHGNRHLSNHIIQSVNKDQSYTHTNTHWNTHVHTKVFQVTMLIFPNSKAKDLLKWLKSSCFFKSSSIHIQFQVNSETVIAAKHISLYLPVFRVWKFFLCVTIPPQQENIVQGSTKRQDYSCILHVQESTLESIAEHSGCKHSLNIHTFFLVLKSVSAWCSHVLNHSLKTGGECSLTEWISTEKKFCLPLLQFGVVMLTDTGVKA